MKHKIETISIMACTYADLKHVKPAMQAFVHRMGKKGVKNYNRLTPASQERVLRAAKKLVQSC